MKSILEQLSSMTVVVADTGDLDSIKKFQPRDATTNPLHKKLLMVLIQTKKFVVLSRPYQLMIQNMLFL